jgi:hypothetical protein
LTDEKILGLFRFGPQDRMEQFLQGDLYLNTLSFIRELEQSDGLRSDPSEGSTWWLLSSISPLSVKIGETFTEIPGLLGPIKFFGNSELRANVLCLYAARGLRVPTPVDPRILTFGDTAVLLTDGDEFLRRVRAAAKAIGQTATCSIVKYVDSQIHNGPTGIFVKPNEFGYQSECRVARTPGTGEPLKLSLGSLADIALLGPSSELNTYRGGTASHPNDRKAAAYLGVISPPSFP